MFPGWRSLCPKALWDPVTCWPSSNRLKPEPGLRSERPSCWTTRWTWSERWCTPTPWCSPTQRVPSSSNTTRRNISDYLNRCWGNLFLSAPSLCKCRPVFVCIEDLIVVFLTQVNKAKVNDLINHSKQVQTSFFFFDIPFKYWSYTVYVGVVVTVCSQRASEWHGHGGAAAGDRLLHWAAETQLWVRLSVRALQVRHGRVQQQVSA